MSCYNFTVFELASKDGFCFLSHEGQTGRGSCEIASFLYQYLLHVDEQGCEILELYSDGCVGQNKNSILPSMIMYFVERSHSVKQVTLNFFETNHEQSEGDAMHSAVERAMKKVGEIFVPSQLLMVIKLARKTPKPYTVISVKSPDIKDWKSYSQSKGILRVRSTERGTNVDWTKFMSVCVSKDETNTVKFKYSHTDATYEILKIGETRRHSSHIQLAEPQSLYPSGYRSISEAKYEDLQSLCSGPTPVVGHPDYKTFYRQLHH